jgi:SAM-dependent methyltransferase
VRLRLAGIDGGRAFDWGRTSEDYAAHRPSPPESLFDRLAALGIGSPGQRIVDLATGTGAMARPLARRGARVVGVDLAANQVAAARGLAGGPGYAVARVEALPFPDRSFDAATANQCWLYFDLAPTLRELRRVLARGGLLAVSHVSWLADDPVARATEDLVLRFNPGWTGARWDGRVELCPGWAGAGVDFVGGFVYDEAIPFTRETWRGRIRACRGVGASLAEAEVAAFDREHADLLERLVSVRFTVTHRIDARVLRLAG